MNEIDLSMEAGICVSSKVDFQPLIKLLTSKFHSRTVVTLWKMDLI